MKPRKPAKSGNGALRFPWQPKGDAVVPLPSPPQRTGPAQAVSIATGGHHPCPHALQPLLRPARDPEFCVLYCGNMRLQSLTGRN